MDPLAAWQPARHRTLEPGDTLFSSVVQATIPPLRKGGEGGVRRASLCVADRKSISVTRELILRFLDEPAARAAPTPPGPPLRRGGRRSGSSCSFSNGARDECATN